MLVQGNVYNVHNEYFNSHMCMHSRNYLRAHMHIHLHEG